jgi:hypothetical protein
MKAEEKAEWVAALRSGEYPQGQNRLRNVDDTFCCLGVKADLEVKKGNGRWESFIDPNGFNKWFYFSTTGASFCGGLPSEMIGGNNETEGDLIELNDDREESFAEIADWIEKNITVDDEVTV